MTLEITIGLVSAVAAIISVVFAWKAVKVAEKSNATGLLSELHEIFRSDTIFHATKAVWKLYGSYQTDPDGEMPISSEQAMKFVYEAPDKCPDEWKAVHNLVRFWGYLALLVNEGHIKESTAFAAFGVPRILGFLYPVEAAFAAYRNKTYDYDRSLKPYYDRWKRQ